MQTKKIRRAGVLIVVVLGSVTSTANRSVVAQQAARQPRTAAQAFKNIQVIKNVPAAQLQVTMQFIASSLGVDCSHCHIPPNMEKDDKPTKQTARRMMVMMNEINRNFGDKTMVNCATCHRGQLRPSGTPPVPTLISPFVSGTISAAQQKLPTVDEILSRYVLALGGDRALNKVTTRTRKGWVEVAGVRGTFELFEAAPNKSLLVGQLPPPLGAVHQGFDGIKGWVQNQNGVFEMGAEGTAQAKRESNFNADTRLKEQFQTMDLVGRERSGNREFYVIQGTRLDGQVERLFFDIQSGLLTRRYWETGTNFGPLPNVIDYDNYKKVGSLRLPLTIRRSRAGTTLLQNISELKLNVKLDDSIFKKPAAPPK